MECASRELAPLVARFPRSTSPGLIEGVGREHTQQERSIDLPGDGAEPGRGLTGHVVEVWRLSPNHTSQGDERVVAVQSRDPPGRLWKLPCTRHPVDVHRIRPDAELLEGAPARFQHFSRHIVVKTCDDDPDAPARRRIRIRKVRADVDLHSPLQEVAQLGFLRVEITLVVLPTPHSERFRTGDLEIVSLEPDDLPWIVGEQANPLKPKI